MITVATASGMRFLIAYALNVGSKDFVQLPLDLSRPTCRYGRDTKHRIAFDFLYVNELWESDTELERVLTGKVVSVLQESRMN